MQQDTGLKSQRLDESRRQDQDDLRLVDALEAAPAVTVAASEAADGGTVAAASSMKHNSSSNQRTMSSFDDADFCGEHENQSKI